MSLLLEMLRTVRMRIFVFWSVPLAVVEVIGRSIDRPHERDIALSHQSSGGLHAARPPPAAPRCTPCPLQGACVGTLWLLRAPG